VQRPVPSRDQDEAAVHVDIPLMDPPQCPPCVQYVAQIGRSIALTGQVDGTPRRPHPAEPDPALPGLADQQPLTRDGGQAWSGTPPHECSHTRMTRGPDDRSQPRLTTYRYSRDQATATSARRCLRQVRRTHNHGYGAKNSGNSQGAPLVPTRRSTSRQCLPAPLDERVWRATPSLVQEVSRLTIGQRRWSGRGLRRQIDVETASTIYVGHGDRPGM
jgi:hypothetical protein